MMKEPETVYERALRYGKTAYEAWWLNVAPSGTPAWDSLSLQHQLWWGEVAVSVEVAVVRDGLPPVTSARAVRLEDGHVLIGDDRENVVLSPGSARAVTMALWAMFGAEVEVRPAKLPSEQMREWGRSRLARAGATTDCERHTVEIAAIVAYLDEQYRERMGGQK